MSVVEFISHALPEGLQKEPLPRMPDNAGSDTKADKDRKDPSGVYG